MACIQSCFLAAAFSADGLNQASEHGFTCGRLIGASGRIDPD
jgi:hypothetical protein